MKAQLKRGDTRRGISAVLKGPNGSPVDLSFAQVEFRMRRGTFFLEREALVLDAENGRVAFAFEAGDTDKAGIYSGEFEVTYPDASTETFPNNGHILIYINESLKEV